MASIINSDDGVISGTAGLKSTGANDGALNIQTNGTNAITVSSSQTVAINGNNISADNSLGFRNRIINGAMVIDQRNAGASVTPTTSGTYTLDRWAALLTVSSKFSVQQNAGSVTPPAGFKNYLGATSLSAYSVGASEIFSFRHTIEGFNIADLGWGAAGAKTVTLSFWVRSSLTGTFGGALNSPGNNYSYPFTYTISATNTWEQKTITIAGPTAGTWGSTNGSGIAVIFNLGAGATFSGTAGAWVASDLYSATGAVSVVGTNAATWYVTGVQLEVGSVATPFERRDYGRELAMCQRYYYKVVTAAASGEVLAPSGFVDTSTTAFCWTQFPVSMRTAPTALEQTGTAANYQVRSGSGGSTNCSAVPTFNAASVWGARSLFTVASGLTAGQSVALQTASTAGIYLAWSAEL